MRSLNVSKICNVGCLSNGLSIVLHGYRLNTIEEAGLYVVVLHAEWTMEYEAGVVDDEWMHASCLLMFTACPLCDLARLQRWTVNDN